MTAERSLTPETPWAARPLWSLVESREAFGGDLPLLSVSAKFGVRLRPEGEGRAASADTSGYRAVKRDDLVVNKLSAKDGAYALSRLDGLVSPAYWVLRPTTPAAATSWLHYVLHSSPYRAEIGRLSKFMPPAQFDLSWEQFRKVRIPIPSLSAQQAIAAYLDAETARIEALIAKKRRLIDALEERRLAAIEEGVAEAVASAGTGSNRLKRVCRIERGRFTHRPRSDPALYDGPYPFVQTGDVRSADKELSGHTQTLNELGRAASRSFSAGTILMAIAANVGDVAITTYEVYCPDSVVGFLPGPDLDTDFLYYLLMGQRRRINETSTENTQENTNVEILGELPIELPPLGRQRQIADVLARRDRLISAVRRRLRTQIDLLEEHRQALVTASVTGELAVPELAP